MEKITRIYESNVLLFFLRIAVAIVIIISTRVVFFEKMILNWPRSIYQYSNMALRLLGQNCKF